MRKTLSIAQSASVDHDDSLMSSSHQQSAAPSTASSHSHSLMHQGAGSLLRQSFPLHLSESGAQESAILDSATLGELDSSSLEEAQPEDLDGDRYTQPPLDFNPHNYFLFLQKLGILGVKLIN